MTYTMKHTPNFSTDEFLRNIFWLAVFNEKEGNFFHYVEYQRFNFFEEYSPPKTYERNAAENILILK